MALPVGFLTRLRQGSIVSTTERPCPLIRAAVRCAISAVAILVVSRLPLVDAQQPAPRPLGERPNIVMIFTDDQGWNDVGCYGSEIPTPHIDRLAGQGIQLTQFYAASSICTPSRYGLLTGRYPHRSRDHLLGALMFLTPEDARRGIHPGETTYVQRLHEAGYTTALIGKWHLGHGDERFWPTRHGFDSFFGHTGGCVDFFTLQYGDRPDWYRGRQLVQPDGYATDVITDEAVSFIHSQQDAAAPFYLHVAYNAPHFGKGWDAEAQTTVNVMQPKPEDLRRVAQIADPLRRAFAAKVVGMDSGVGRLMEALDQAGIDQQTLVIFMTDHGGDPDYGGSNAPLRGGKATLFEGGLRVPCIARWPGKIQAGSQSDTVACAIDIYPTLCGIAGLDCAGDPLDGIDLRTVIGQPDVGGDRQLVWQTGRHAELDRQSWGAIRQGDWKWVQPPGSEPMLFQLSEDPHEANDLAAAEPARADALGQAFERSVQGERR